MSQMVSMAWDGHHKTVMSVLEKLLECSTLVDCTIAAEGQKLKAHKEVLSAFSPYFELLFREETQKNPTVILSGIDFRDLKSLIYFMYHGILEVPENRFHDLMEVAECLKIKGLGGAHEKEGSGKTKNTSSVRKLLPDSCDIPYKRTRQVQGEVAVNLLSQEADVDDTNNETHSLHQNSSDACSAHLIKQSSDQNTMQNFDMHNVLCERSRPFNHTQSNLSIEINNLLLNGVTVVKVEPSLGSVMEPRIIDDSEMNVCEKNENSFETNKDSVLIFHSDVSETSYDNHYEEFLPGTVESPLCGRDLLEFSVTKVDHMNTTSLFPSVDEAVSAAEAQNLFIHTELIIKDEPNADEEIPLSEDDNLRTNYGECSNTLRNSGVPPVSEEMLAKQKEKCSTQNPIIHSEPTVSNELSLKDEIFFPEDDNLRTNYGEYSQTMLGNSGVSSVSEEMLDNHNDQCGTQNLFIHSELILKTEQSSEDEMYLPEDDNLRTNNGECLERTLQCVGVPSAPEADMLAKQNDECGSDYSVAESRCAEEEPVPSQQHLLGVPIETDERETNKSAVQVFQAPLEEAAEQHAPPPATRLSHTSLCQSDFSGPSGNDSKMGSSSTEKQYCCQYCSCAFTLKSHLKRHQQTTHIRSTETNNASQKSTETNNASANRSVLGKNKRTHTGKKQYKCTECDFTAAYSTNLKAHQRTHSGIKPYKCTECNFSAAQRSNLKRHQNIHIGSKPYKCTECKYATAHRFDLIIHQRTHSGIKPFKCTECDFTTAASCNLKTHQRTHSGNKPYRCTDCEYTTRDNSSLKRHQRTHSGIKPYKCRECDYTTAQISNLKTHQVIHSGIKPFKCSKCDYTTARNSTLKRHKLIHSSL